MSTTKLLDRALQEEMIYQDSVIAQSLLVLVSLIDGLGAIGRVRCFSYVVELKEGCGSYGEPPHLMPHELYNPHTIDPNRGEVPP